MAKAMSRRLADGTIRVLAPGKRWLSRRVTSADDPIYFFTDAINAITVGAAAARLSRSPGDLRGILLQEFAGRDDQRDALVDRVVASYGDDSVMQLVPLQFATERVSNLMTKVIERSRLMGYLEQSTRYIPFDQKDENGRWLYYTPTNLTGELRERYEMIMDQIFELYSEMVHGLIEHVRAAEPLQDESQRQAWLGSTRAKACDAARVVLPVATRSSVMVIGNAQTVQNLYIYLRSLGYAEADEVAEGLLRQVRELDGMKPFLRRADAAHRGGAISRYMAANRAAMADEAGPPIWGRPEEGVEVRLIDYGPSYENSLVPRMLYEQSGESLEVLVNQAPNRFSAEDCRRIIERYCGDRFNRRAKPSRAIEKAWFEWEIVGDYGTFRDLQRHRMLSGIEWQQLTTRHGYDVPPLVVEAGFEEQFEQCFALSGELFDVLVAAGLSTEAQYATLLGHRMRYTFTANLRELFHMLELRTQPAGHPGYRAICQRMYELLAEVYPTFAAQMLINMDDDPALGRLDAELIAAARQQELSSG